MYNLKLYYVLSFSLRSLVVILRLFLCYFCIKFYYIIVVQTLIVWYLFRIWTAHQKSKTLSRYENYNIIILCVSCVKKPRATLHDVAYHLRCIMCSCILYTFQMLNIACLRSTLKHNMPLHVYLAPRIDWYWQKHYSGKKIK